MCHHQRTSRDKLDGEVAIRNGVERIPANTVEAKFPRDKFAVDWKAGAGQCGGPERQAVDAFAAIYHSVFVAREHFDVRHHVVAKCYRLRHLQMGEARHDGLGMGQGLSGEGHLQILDLTVEVIHHVANIKPEIGCNLVIARACRMQSACWSANNLLEALLDVHVNVLKGHRKRELAAFDLCLNLIQSAPNFSGVGF